MSDFTLNNNITHETWCSSGHSIYAGGATLLLERGMIVDNGISADEAEIPGYYSRDIALEGADLSLINVTMFGVSYFSLNL